MSKTVSTCASQTEQGTHVFRVIGYNGIGDCKFMSSDHFCIGGHDWKLVFVPNAHNLSHNPESHKDRATLALCFLGKEKVHASFELRLLDQTKGASVSVYKKEPRTFEPDNDTKFSARSIKRDLLKALAKDDDCLTIECTVTVYKHPNVTPTKSLPRIHVPQSDMAEHFGKLLETKEGVDVTFIVGGETFGAHKIVLATRSPVFKAELYGPLKKDGTEPITVKDLQPAVFQALLHFIYTDTLPSMDDLKGDDRCEMIRHLLVAADRYAVERLNLMCQSFLCEDLQVHNVATTLALADQHGCGMLMDACFEFITCSNAMEAVVKTEGYKNLKRSCPSVAIEALEKTSKSRKA